MSDNKPVNLWFAIPYGLNPGTYVLGKGPLHVSTNLTVDSVGETKLQFPVLVGPGATDHVAVRVDTGEVIHLWPDSQT